MGNKYEVRAWVHIVGDIYEYQVVYAGESLIRAVVAAVKAKRHNGCVKVEWR